MRSSGVRLLLGHRVVTLKGAVGEGKRKREREKENKDEIGQIEVHSGRRSALPISASTRDQ